MSRTTPRVGIDRYLDPMWMSMAAEVVRGETKREDFDARLALDIRAQEVRIKTSGILNRIWFSPEKDLATLAIRAANYMTANEERNPLAFIAVTIGAYPYFSQVVETVGMLINLQGSCSPGEVHRRMYERHGKSRTIALANAKVFRTMIAWGLLQRGRAKRLQPVGSRAMDQDGRALLNMGAGLARGAISPLSNGDPLLFAFRTREQQT